MKDETAKRKKKAVLVILVLLVLVVIVQMGAQSYGILMLGGEKIVPQIQTVSAVLLIFFFSIFDSTLFGVKGYEILWSLPISRKDIAMGRMIKMYVVYFFLAILVMLPGIMVYGINVHPAAGFFVRFFLGILFLPVLPLSVSTALQMFIQLVAARSRHRTGVKTILTVLMLAVLSGMCFFLSMGTFPDLSKPENLIFILENMLEQQFPGWMRNWLVSFKDLFIFAGVSVFAGMLVCILVCRNFTGMIAGLSSVSGKHGSHTGMGYQKSVLMALCKKEARRYFSSSVYVSNTIVGPILAAAGTAALFFVDLEPVKNILNVPLEYLAPVAWCCIGCIMFPSSVSISMEGDRVWIIKSLPLSMKTILDAKMLFALILYLPFYLISEILFMILFRPSVGEVLWLLAAPIVMLVFSSIFSLSVNLKFQNFNWKKDEEIVKQSASSMIGGLLPTVVLFLCGGGIALIPVSWIRPAILAVLLLISAMLYRKNMHEKLKDQ